MKKIFLIFLIFSLINGCSFKPLYKTTDSFSNYKISIVIKSKERYDNDASLFKLFLEKKLNSNATKKSHLKLVVSIQKTISALGIDKDIFSTGHILTYGARYSLYDKSGLLTSGEISRKSSYNLTANTYANLISVEDSSQKLLKYLSENISYMILAKNFKRKVIP